MKRIIIAVVVLLLIPSLVNGQGGQNTTQLFEDAELLSQELEDLDISTVNIRNLLDDAKAQKVSGDGDFIVIETLNQAISRAKMARDISDQIHALELRILDNANYEVFEIQAVLDTAKFMFESERYESAQSLVNKANEDLDKILIDSIRSDISTTSVFYDTYKELLYSNRYAATLFGVVIIFIFTYNRRRQTVLRIQSLDSEEKVIEEMMRRSQIEMFENKTISKMKYKIRMQVYRSMLNESRKEKRIVQGK